MAGRRTLRLVAAGVLLVTLSACSGDGDDKVSSEAGSTSSSTSTSMPEDMSASTSSTAGTTAAAAGGTPAPSPTTTARPGTTTTAARTATTKPPPATTTTARSGPTAAITIQNFTFTPAVLNISPGTTVTATNRDSAPHTWTADDGSWDSGTLGKDAKYSRTFASAGTFPYHCDIHPSMKATVHVG